MNDGKFYTPRS